MDYYYYPLSPSYGQANVFYMSKNEVTKFDGILGMEGEVVDHFYEVFPFYSYSRSTKVIIDGQTPWLYTAWFQESMNKKLITRRVSSVLDALAEVGGLVNILLLVVAVLIGWFQKFLFEAHLVSEIFIESSTDYYSRMQFDTPKLNKDEDLTGLDDMQIYRRKVVARQPFRYRLASFCRSICCSGSGSKNKVKARRQMYNNAIKQLRKEFDILHLIKRMRKLGLVKLVMLRQYQRRILRYAKKYVV